MPTPTIGTLSCPGCHRRGRPVLPTQLCQLARTPQALRAKADLGSARQGITPGGAGSTAPGGGGKPGPTHLLPCLGVQALAIGLQALSHRPSTYHDSPGKITANAVFTSFPTPTELDLETLWAPRDGFSQLRLWGPPPCPKLTHGCGSHPCRPHRPSWGRMTGGGARQGWGRPPDSQWHHAPQTTTAVTSQAPCYNITEHTGLPLGSQSRKSAVCSYKGL